MDVMYLGRFVPWDVLSLGPFCPLGRFVPWDVLSLGTICPLGRFVPWDVLSLETFCPWTFCSWDVLSLDVLYVHRVGAHEDVSQPNYSVFTFLLSDADIFLPCQVKSSYTNSAFSNATLRLLCLTCPIWCYCHFKK